MKSFVFSVLVEQLFLLKLFLLLLAATFYNTAKFTQMKSALSRKLLFHCAPAAQLIAFQVEIRLNVFNYAIDSSFQR